MDLPAILARAPEVCLIDELAHTNAPGLEHPKRYQDVEDVMAAGIDVLSTMNVQHLESLNDQITELTDIRVRETIPDDVLGRADELVIIDLTPEELIEQAAGGKDLPTRAHRRGAQQLLPDRESGGAARGGVAPGRPGSRSETAHHGARGLARGEPRHRRPAGRGRAAAGVDRAIPGCTAAYSPRLALGATARRRSGPPMGDVTATQALCRRGTVARRSAPIGLAARRPSAGRGVGRCASYGGRGRPPPGHHIHPPGSEPSSPGSGSAAHAAAPAPDGAPAQSGRTHSGRPRRAAYRGEGMSVWVVVAVGVVALVIGAGCRLLAAAPRPAAHQKPPPARATHPVAVHGAGNLAASLRGRQSASPRPKTRRSCRPSSRGFRDSCRSSRHSQCSVAKACHCSRRSSSA